MSEENRAPEDVQPLAAPVHEQQLARPVSAEQEEASQVDQEQQEASRPKEGRAKAPQEKQESSRLEGEQAQEKGLIDKAKEAIDKARNKLAGG